MSLDSGSLGAGRRAFDAKLAELDINHEDEKAENIADYGVQDEKKLFELGIKATAHLRD